MEKLTRILAVVERREDGLAVIEKAVALARCFGARVELLVGEVAHARELATHCDVMRYDEVTLTNLHRGAQPTQAVILRRVLESHPDLLVKAISGIQRDDDWLLANECPAPVMLVRHRRWPKPARFAAAVDVADRESTQLARSILHTAGFLSMGLHGNLDVLYSEREQHDETVRMERAVRLAQVVREFYVGCERIQAFSGDPGKTLPARVAERHYDVLVLGVHPQPPRQPRLKTLFGCTTNAMIELTDGDVLLVKPPPHEIVSAKDFSFSGREQSADEIEQSV